MIVNYRGIDWTRTMEASVRDWAAELDDVYDGIARCDVLVEALPAGRWMPRYRVRLAIDVPGEEIVVMRDPRPDAVPEDPSAAVRDSFRVARRRVEQYVWRNPRDDLAAPGTAARSG